MPEQRVLVIGLGNPLLTDDGIGHWLIDRLGTESLTGTTFKKQLDIDVSDVLDMCGYDKIIIIDALDMGMQLGEVSMIEPSEKDVSGDVISLHGQNLFEILEVGRRIYPDFPGRVYVLGVQVKDPFSWYEGFTPELTEVLEKMLKSVRNAIQKLIE